MSGVMFLFGNFAVLFIFGFLAPSIPNIKHGKVGVDFSVEGKTNLTVIVRYLDAFGHGNLRVL